MRTAFDHDSAKDLETIRLPRSVGIFIVLALMDVLATTISLAAV